MVSGKNLEDVLTEEKNAGLVQRADASFYNAFIKISGARIRTIRNYLIAGAAPTYYFAGYQSGFQATGSVSSGLLLGLIVSIYVSTSLAYLFDRLEKYSKTKFGY